MRAYVVTYRSAFQTTWTCTAPFRISPFARLHTSVKAGNLSACFLGFCSANDDRNSRRSAELGLLAALFDLCSDQLAYEKSALDRFNQFADCILDRSPAEILRDLMDKKMRKALRNDGLDRGVGAFRVVLKHLQTEAFWEKRINVDDVGLILQIVDDVLDRSHDRRRGELNFLEHRNAANYLQRLQSWPYLKDLNPSLHPFVLFKAIGRAQRTANLLVPPATNFLARRIAP
jgi:hypothetical protein